MRSFIYTRISDDQEGLALGVQRQEEDCRALAVSLGAQVGRVFTDNDLSASTLAKKPRPQFLAMLAAVEAGEADVVIAYSNSRLTRRPRELEDLIDLHTKTGVRIKTVVSGDDDLSTADGRMVARIKANVDAAEAERTGERVKRQKQQRLQSGMPLGSRYRTYGYNRDWTINEPEAAVVREVFNRVLAGESINSVSNDLSARGLETVSGKAWRFAVTHRILGNATYAGLLTYKGEVTGKSSVPALVDEAVFESCQNRESKPGFNARKHLLSGIAVCDACKTPMVATKTARGTDKYVCARLAGGCGRISIKTEWLDDVVNAYMSHMVLPQYSDEPEPVEEDDSPNPVDLIDEQIAVAQKAHDDGDIDLADLLPLLKTLRSRRKDALKVQTVKVEKDAWQPIEDYDSADLSIKRALIKKRITALMIRPAKRGSTKFDDSRFYVLMADGNVYAGAAINAPDLRRRIGPMFPSPDATEAAEIAADSARARAAH